MPFKFSLNDLENLKAYKKFQQAWNPRSRYQRHVDGDQLGGVGRAARKKRPFPIHLYGGFRSLYQGDHLGVEFALQGHSGLLASGGLLQEGRQLRGHSPLPLGDQWEALIIDDYFAIGAEPLGDPVLNSFAAKALATARSIYEIEGVIGSTEKDIEAAPRFKAAGAEINSEANVVRDGAITVAAPAAKRLALAALSLRAARMPIITSKLASRLAGNWVSILLYRKCLSCAVSSFFSLTAELEQGLTNKIVPFRREAADELVSLACLAPIMASNIALPTSSRIHAVDASLGLGAIVATDVPAAVASSLWLGGDKKGQILPLDNPFREILAAVGEEADEGESLPEKLTAGPPRPLMMQCDFVEFFGGAGVISKAATSLGLTCAPPLDLSESSHYDLHGSRLLEWCCHMLATNRFRSCTIEPPCTSFSPAAHPCVRSYVLPWGFDRFEAKTLSGNTSALRGFTLLWFCYIYERPSLLEQPRLSKMCWTHIWRRFIRRGLREAVVASCQFGSPHRKEFRLLTYLLDETFIDTRCPGGHQHLRIEGRYTKPSAAYTPALGLHLAKAFRAALEKLDRKDDLKVHGLESILVNDVLATSQWRPLRAWRWKTKSHINVLESSTIVSLLKEIAWKEPDSRQVILSDSRVSIGCISKGRSPSFLLQRQCKMSGALQAAAGIYPSLCFAPTRLNTADDPTRLQEIREAYKFSIVDHLPIESLHLLHFHRFARFAAGWIRLTILLSFPKLARASSWPFPCSAWTAHEEPLLSATTSALDALFSFRGDTLLCSAWIALDSLAYVSGLVFVCCACFCCFYLFVVSVVRCLRPLGPLGVFLLVAVAPAAAMEPLNGAERARAIARTAVNLQATRTVRTETRANREKLLELFKVWLYEQHGLLLSVLLTEKPADPQKVAHLLALYGKDLFWAGKSYGRYSETINSVAAARPAWRKSMNEAWDLAFAWLADEPHQHHPALPLSILLSMISVALVWGWPTEAAVLALTWAGILRIGEVLLATRGDLILPDDSAPGTPYILLKIKSPKTRGRAAQHQAARVDAKDFVLLITKVYENLGDDEPLWPFSAATLRKRFESLLGAVGLSAKPTGGQRPFSLGSLRPGGATHMLYLTEDSELTRRRGRWLAYRTMEIYLQEVVVATAIEKLSEIAKKKVKSYAACFPEVLTHVIKLMNLGIPPTVWYNLTRHMATVELG